MGDIVLLARKGPRPCLFRVTGSGFRFQSGFRIKSQVPGPGPGSESLVEGPGCHPIRVLPVPGSGSRLLLLLLLLPLLLLLLMLLMLMLLLLLLGSCSGSRFPGVAGDEKSDILGVYATLLLN